MYFDGRVGGKVTKLHWSWAGMRLCKRNEFVLYYIIKESAARERPRVILFISKQTGDWATTPSWDI
jgi:hypothetical protein